MLSKRQIEFISMMNSYRIITGEKEFGEIVDSNLSFFFHMPDEIPTNNVFDDMIAYFQGKEMYEHCAVLQDMQDKLYDENGTPLYSTCSGDEPDIQEYTIATICETCKKVVGK
jgi:hypothetical protein